MCGSKRVLQIYGWCVRGPASALALGLEISREHIPYCLWNGAAQCFWFTLTKVWVFLQVLEP